MANPDRNKASLSSPTAGQKNHLVSRCLGGFFSFSFFQLASIVTWVTVGGLFLSLVYFWWLHIWSWWDKRSVKKVSYQISKCSASFAKKPSPAYSYYKSSGKIRISFLLFALREIQSNAQTTFSKNHPFPKIQGAWLRKWDLGWEGGLSLGDIKMTQIRHLFVFLNILPHFRNQEICCQRRRKAMI